MGEQNSLPSKSAVRAMTDEELIAFFLEENKTKRDDRGRVIGDQKYSTATIQAYRESLIDHSRYFRDVRNTNLLQASKADILARVKYLKELRPRNLGEPKDGASSKRTLKASSVNRHLYPLRKLYQFLQENDYRADNPLAGIPVLKHTNRNIRVLSPDELEKIERALLSHAFNGRALRINAMFNLAAFASFRASEIITLKRGALLPDMRNVRVTASPDQARVIADMHEAAKSALRDYLATAEPSNWVFYGRDPDKHVTRSVVNNDFAELAKKAGIDEFRPADLRHTFAAMFLSAGYSAWKVEGMLGASIQPKSLYENTKDEDYKTFIARSRFPREALAVIYQ